MAALWRWATGARSQPPAAASGYRAPGYRSYPSDDDEYVPFVRVNSDASRAAAALSVGGRNGMDVRRRQPDLLDLYGDDNDGGFDSDGDPDSGGGGVDMGSDTGDSGGSDGGGSGYFSGFGGVYGGGRGSAKTARRRFLSYDGGVVSKRIRETTLATNIKHSKMFIACNVAVTALTLMLVVVAVVANPRHRMSIWYRSAEYAVMFLLSIDLWVEVSFQGCRRFSCYANDDGTDTGRSAVGRCGGRWPCCCTCYRCLGCCLGWTQVRASSSNRVWSLSLTCRTVAGAGTIAHGI
jgi:hypothetical protein